MITTYLAYVAEFEHLLDPKSVICMCYNSRVLLIRPCWPLNQTAPCRVFRSFRITAQLPV